jgi:hypothetical protein
MSAAAKRADPDRFESLDIYDVDPPMLVLQFEIAPEFHDLLETSPEDKDRLTDLIRDGGGIRDRLLVACKDRKLI